LIFPPILKKVFLNKKMCGLAGFVGFKDDDLIRRMTKTMVHRGPDDENYFISSQASLGHRRLSIIDLSHKACQPIFNENKSVVLVYNGEIYNFQELKNELLKKGHKFRSQTDSEVIIHAYEEWGILSVKKFRGFFAFALWDMKKKNLFLVRDRIGVKPLYYFQKNQQIFFASEIKAILENKNIRKEVNQESFYQYLAFQSTLGEQTLFEKIKKLPPATILSFNGEKIVFKKYWELESKNNLENKSQEQLEKEFEKILKESVKIRLSSDVPLGVLLSGGLDSSSIVALMSQTEKNRIKTFSVGFGEPDDEFKYARLVAQKFNTDHQEMVIKPKDLKQVLLKIVWHQDEPLADGGGIATFLAAKEVSQHVKVVLVGEGGDELFGGYSWYKLGAFPLNLIPVSFREKIYFYLTTFYQKDNCQKIDQFINFKKIFDLNKIDFLHQMMKFEIENILPNSLCMKVDKMTSAWGLEAREPFLDYRLAEFCFSLPVDQKISLNNDKILFRKVMSRLLPKEIINRKKHGFLMPTEKWLKGELKEFTREILMSKTSYTRKIYSLSQIEKFFKPQSFLVEFERINLLWRLLIFDLWYKIYFK
jgi:asparagine synthase (glutamine-hydrolysing)